MVSVYQPDTNKRLSRTCL